MDAIDYVCEMCLGGGCEVCLGPVAPPGPAGLPEFFDPASGTWSSTPQVGSVTPEAPCPHTGGEGQV